MRRHHLHRALSVLVSSGAALACDGVAPPAAPPPSCVSDRDCANGDLCDGLERCEEGVCAFASKGPPLADTFLCDTAGSPLSACDGAGSCGAPAACASPGTPQVAFVPRGVTVPVRWSADAGGRVFGALEAAVVPAGEPPIAWHDVDDAGVQLEALVPSGTPPDAVVSLWLRSAGGCEGEVHAADYDLAAPSAPVPRSGADTREGAEASSLVALSDPRIVGWAVECVDLRPGLRVDAAWLDPRLALGPAGHDPYDVLTLGEGGEATFALPGPVSDGPGPELAIFENAVPDDFIELARVEVSTDGEHFAAFDTVSLIDAPVAAYDRMSGHLVDGFAGPAPLGFGVPFDLSRLSRHPAVLSGYVDLDAIRFVRIVDVIGDGSVRDSFGQPVWDPFPTYGSAGFDLDAIAVLSSP